jgi:small multidrug resistance family-3 protein
MTVLAWVIFLAAACLEVGGDAVVRRGLRGSSLWIVLAGCLMLGAYGVVVNKVPWDFSKLLGVYVAVFATVSIFFGRIFFKDAIPSSSWFGLGLIICGSLVIQFGRR